MINQVKDPIWGSFNPNWFKTIFGWFNPIGFETFGFNLYVLGTISVWILIGIIIKLTLILIKKIFSKNLENRQPDNSNNSENSNNLNNLNNSNNSSINDLLKESFKNLILTWLIGLFFVPLLVYFAIKSLTTYRNYLTEEYNQIDADRESSGKSGNFIVSILTKIIIRFFQFINYILFLAVFAVVIYLSYTHNIPYLTLWSAGLVISVLAFIKHYLSFLGAAADRSPKVNENIKKGFKILLLAFILLNVFTISVMTLDLSRNPLFAHNSELLSEKPLNNLQAESNNISLKIMTYNIRLGTAIEKNPANNWVNRKDDLAKYIQTFDLDIIGVQEAFYFQITYLLGELNRLEIEQKEMGNLTDKPRKYEFTGFGRDDAVHGGEHSAILFDINKYEFLDGDTFWLSEFPSIPSKSWNSAHHRVCTWAIFRERESGFIFLVLCTHFDFNSVFHVNAMKLIRHRILSYTNSIDPRTTVESLDNYQGTINKPEIPILLMGDMNFNSESLGYNEITNSNAIYYLNDSFREFYNGSEPNEYTVSKFDANYHSDTNRRIDFIFINDYVSIENCTIPKDSYGLNQTYSDHYPVNLDAILHK